MTRTSDRGCGRPGWRGRSPSLRWTGIGARSILKPSIPTRPNMMFRSASSIPWEVTSGTRGFGRLEVVDPAISFESQGEAARIGASQARAAASVIYVTPYSPRHW